MRIALGVAWNTALILYVLAGTSTAPFHGDESMLIAMGNDFYDHVEGMGWRVRFRNPPPDPGAQLNRLINGTIPKYLIGAQGASG